MYGEAGSVPTEEKITAYEHGHRACLQGAPANTI